jgi:hypothetical protein
MPVDKDLKRLVRARMATTTCCAPLDSATGRGAFRCRSTEAASHAGAPRRPTLPLVAASLTQGLVAREPPPAAASLLTAGYRRSVSKTPGTVQARAQVVHATTRGGTTTRRRGYTRYSIGD